MRCIADLSYGEFQICEPCDPDQCEDGDPCTDDGCGADGCEFIPLPDGTNCGGDATCENGVCVGGVCGDSVRQDGELCDGMDLGGASCVTEGFDSGSLGCTPSCTLDTSNCCTDNTQSQCVDGDVYWVDSCGNIGSQKDSCSVSETCVQVSATEAECQSVPPTCGNGVLDPGEPCDDDLFAPASTCQDLGFDSGAVSCNQNCSLDTLGCCNDDDYYQCSGGDVYWFDSCGNIGAKKSECGAGSCYNTGNQTAECEVCECNAGVCCDGCSYLPANIVCQQDADTEYDCPWGMNPGDDVGVRTRDRLCSGTSSSCDGGYGSWSGWFQADDCAVDEVCEPGDTTCNSTCPENNYWLPPLDSDIDDTGLQSNQSIDVSIQMLVNESGNQLEFQVCKIGSDFQEDVKVAIYDGATNSAVGKLSFDLPTAGEPCSPWIPLEADENYQEGEVFGGVWNLVSPSTSAGEWPTWGPCSVNGNPTGTCWSGIGITLTRTCKQ
jgi:hypothetical protein